VAAGGRDTVGGGWSITRGGGASSIVRSSWQGKIREWNVEKQTVNDTFGGAARQSFAAITRAEKKGGIGARIKQLKRGEQNGTVKSLTEDGMATTRRKQSYTTERRGEHLWNWGISLFKEEELEKEKRKRTHLPNGGHKKGLHRNQKS